MKNRKIIILRHGESEEDKDPAIKSAVNDPAKLTPTGRLQVAEKLSKLLPEYSGFKSYQMYYSPSARVRETMEIFTGGLRSLYPLVVKEEKSIRNLDWGKTTAENVKQIESERYRVGVLNFQFPDGDHTPTYVRNIDSFCKTILGDMMGHDSVCTTLFTHGFAQRVIVKCLTGMSDEEFRYLANPGNCFSCIMDVGSNSETVEVRMREPFPRINFRID